MYEMNKLETYLKEHGYKYMRHPLYSREGEILSVYDDGYILWDVEYHEEDNMIDFLEGTGVIFGDYETEINLTADDVISRLEALNDC